jgi:tellurite resistance protein TerC
MIHAVLEWSLFIGFLYMSFKGEQILVNNMLKLIKWDRDLLRSSFARCLYWAIVSLLFMLLYYVVSSEEEAEAWTSGFILEYTLSFDNLFIFQLVFKMYNTPESQVDTALIWGIGIASALRLVFFAVGTSLFAWVGWLRVPLGFLLLLTAYKTARLAHFQISPSHLAKQQSSEHPEEEEWNPPHIRSSSLAFAEKYLRFTTKYDRNGRMFQYEFSPDLFKVAGLISVSSPTSSREAPLDSPPGRLKITMLGGVVLVLAIVDMVFALDAVAAKVGQTTSLFINSTSSLFAMASFRGLYFIIAELTSTFSLLKFGVALILVYVAIELIVSSWFVIPHRISLIVIGLICFGSIAGSLLLSLREKLANYRHLKAASEVDIAQAPQSFGLSDENDPPDNPFA